MSSITGYNATTITPLTSGQNHHIALSISGTIHKLYLDGAMIAENPNGGNIFEYYTALSNLYIGCAGDLSYGYTGNIQKFKIWNRVLPLDDISAIYHSG